MDKWICIYYCGIVELHTLLISVLSLFQNLYTKPSFIFRTPCLRNKSTNNEQIITMIVKY